VLNDLPVIAALSVGACLLVGFAGVGLLRLMRGTSLRAQLQVTALLPVLAVAAAVALNVAAMFFSAHDSAVVAVALSIAVVLAAALAWLVTRPIRTGFQAVNDSVQALVDDSMVPLSLGEQARRRDQPPANRSTSADVLPAELATALADLSAARKSLADSREREQAAENARRELVSFMSHDLRTPLAGLRALAEGLEDGIVTDVPRALAQFRATVNRMSMLVDDLFALSRVQGQPENEQRRSVSLAEVVDDVVFEAAETARAADVVLAADVLPDDRLAVLGNHADLTRALTNLVANAIRHTGPGLGVRVRADRTAAGAVRVQVVDQCGGIPEPHLAKVFETGWRGSPARDGDDGGAGLGLAIARGVVRSHDGQIGVRNTGDGCAFELELPSR
jgi:signal transduction histidine kinase